MKELQLLCHEKEKGADERNEFLFDFSDRPEPIYENGDFFAVASITIVCFLITSTNVGVTMVRILGYNAPKPTRVFSIMMLVSVNTIALQ